MKKQNMFLHRLTIVCTSLASLILIPINQVKAQSRIHDPIVQTKPQPPKVAIHTAVITGNIPALKQHIMAGTNIDEKDPFGGSNPLISACVFGKTEIAQLLINAGANINFQNNDGSTPLHSAAFFCRSDIVKILLTKGANKTIKNKYGQTAYELVSGSFATVKGIYNGLSKMLAPMGLQLDYTYIEKTRPQIAAMLK